MEIPSLTTSQMREVDRAMVEDYGVQLLQMMENAGRNLAHLARTRFLAGDPTGRRVLVLAGRGGNGGGGLASARRLHGWGSRVEVVTAAPDTGFQDVPATQLRALERLRVPVKSWARGADLPQADLIVDAIIGYSLTGAPQGSAADLIVMANSHAVPILSLDVPSGLDATTGEAPGAAVQATATLTLALPKTGLHAQSALPFVGELYLADIGVPPRLYASPALGLEVGPIFARKEVLRIR